MNFLLFGSDRLWICKLREKRLHKSPDLNRTDARSIRLHPPFELELELLGRLKTVVRVARDGLENDGFKVAWESRAEHARRLKIADAQKPQHLQVSVRFIEPVASSRFVKKHTEAVDIGAMVEL